MYPTLGLRMFRPTPRLMSAPVEDQAGHTISQRLRKLRKIPPELYPLGVVVVFAVGAACYSLGRKVMVDKNLRLKRQGSLNKSEHKEDHH